MLVLNKQSKEQQNLTKDGNVKYNFVSKDGFCLTVDFCDFHDMYMAAQGTGYDAFAQAKQFKKIVKQNKEDSIKTKIDSGLSESMFERLLNSTIAKDRKDNIRSDMDIF
mmetsp:Transcript_14666/g.22728  ORF Transcript_14666/g.22728 Transcript_14666/m.22728 type:complete len:109 (-) Transcript_14666:1028-1354(-)